MYEKKPGESNLDFSIRIWKEKRYEDAHYAHATTELKPNDIDLKLTGDFLSCVFKTGIRTYMFHGQTNRDRFTNHYRGRGYWVQPCRNPHP